METNQIQRRAAPRRAPANPNGVLRGTELADLTALYDADVMLVTAPMPPGPGAISHAAALASAGPRSWTVRVETPDGTPEPGAIDQLALEGHADARAWVSYVEEVAGVFALLLGARAVGVRQVVSDGPHCPRFHVDKVSARAVLNVAGAPTEWLADADLDRSRLGHAGGDDDATSGLVRRWDRLGRAELGSLTIFKGTGWPDAAERAIVHRSPPADGTRRVLLTLDWLA